MFGFSWGVIAVAVVIIAAVSVIFDIEWYKVALVVAAILFVSVLYRDGKLPDFLEPIASKVFFWVDKGAEETKESKETKELQETKETKKADKSLFSRIKEMGRSQLAKRIFGVRIITLIIIGVLHGGFMFISIGNWARLRLWPLLYLLLWSFTRGINFLSRWNRLWAEFSSMKTT